jgi:hypothetical protein
MKKILSTLLLSFAGENLALAELKGNNKSIFELDKGCINN